MRIELALQEDRVAIARWIVRKIEEAGRGREVVDFVDLRALRWAIRHHHGRRWRGLLRRRVGVLIAIDLVVDIHGRAALEAAAAILESRRSVAESDLLAGGGSMTAIAITITIGGLDDGFAVVLAFPRNLKLLIRCRGLREEWSKKA